MYKFNHLCIDKNNSVVNKLEGHDEYLLTIPNASMWTKSSKRCRVISDVYEYIIHLYRFSDTDILEQDLANDKVNFICTKLKDGWCHLHKDGIIEKKRGFCAVIDREQEDIFVLDTDSTLLKQLKNYQKDFGSLSQYDIILNSSTPYNPQIIASKGEESELSDKDNELKEQLEDNWNADYLSEFAKFEDCLKNVALEKIHFPNGTEGMRCFKCGSDFPYAEPNRANGSFICTGCNMSWQ